VFFFKGSFNKRLHYKYKNKGYVKRAKSKNSLEREESNYKRRFKRALGL